MGTSLSSHRFSPEPFAHLGGKHLSSSSLCPTDGVHLSQARALNLQHWQDFLKVILAAGYRSGKLISSQNNLLFAYILYLMGRTEYGVEEYRLRRLIARWFFMSAITGRYTGSPESQMEFDLARFRGLEGTDQFAAVLTEICDSTLTSDFWNISLPTE